MVNLIFIGHLKDTYMLAAVGLGSCGYWQLWVLAAVGRPLQLWALEAAGLGNNYVNMFGVSIMKKMLYWNSKPISLN